ncbi:carboxymuconolactone decarboxylase family protein [Streptomyces sp. NPDC052309]|uniref:carboxymuconolactone decarboxylase family protein n=1 Tax=Streptomyces sp. NPDC052309 TaxID=3155421 RepID=UPI00343CC939
MTTTESFPRLKLSELTPKVYSAMGRLHATAEEAALQAGLEHSLLELVKIRASQINGCAFCIDMHTLDARAAGETEQRLYALNAWEETPFFSARERAALALTEAVTLVHDGHVGDDVYRAALKEFSEAEVAQLIWAITVINAYNRIAISTRMVPGHYTPKA